MLTLEGKIRSLGRAFTNRLRAKETGWRGFQQLDWYLMEVSKSPNQFIRFHPLLPFKNALLLQHFSLKTCNTCLTLSPEIPLHSRCLMHQGIPIWKEESPSMYPEHFTGERVMAEDPHAPKRNRRTSSHRLPWCYRVCMLLVLTLFGLHLLAAGSGAGSGESLSGQQTASGHDRNCFRNGSPLQVGLGAGATSGGMTNANTPVAVCLNPLDATCWLQNAAQWMAQQVMGALQPVIGAIMHNPLNISDSDTTCRHLSEPGGDYLVECLPRGGRSRPGQPDRHWRL